MRISFATELLIGDVPVSGLSMAGIRRACGPRDVEEEIRLHQGGVRIRKRWSKFGITTIRDTEEEAASLTIDSPELEIKVGDVRLPQLERDFVRAFPAAEKDFGHHFILRSGVWRLDVYFELGAKRRGLGSTIRRLHRVIVTKKDLPNHAPDPTALSVTPAADAPAAPVRGRGSS